MKSRNPATCSRRTALLLAGGAAAAGLSLLPMLEPGTLASLARRIRRHLEGFEGLSDAAIFCKIRTDIEADFRDGRLVRRAGWTIAATEALLFERLDL
ncbi:MAG TPA: hypothetical protein VHB68_11210 [Steroidobacteraceae bacterium]|nr:hypothetical protein [Steroidobacteraceae bacterium]